jgi:hypothetical protein
MVLLVNLSGLVFSTLWVELADLKMKHLEVLRPIFCLDPADMLGLGDYCLVDAFVGGCARRVREDIALWCFNLGLAVAFNVQAHH